MFRKRLALASIILLACSLTVSPAVAQDKVSPLDGTWIGWAYLANGSDLPLRLDLRVVNQKVEATYDSLTRKTFGQPITDVEWRAPALRLGWTSATGNQIKLQGELAAGTIRGSFQSGPQPGTFELTRAPHSIADIDPQKYADTAGFYERVPGDIVEISPRAWGEMLYRERRTGRLRTLLPLASDKFFIGSAVYTPAPVEAYLEFRRDASGQVRDFIEKRSDGRSRRWKRLTIREEAVEFRSGDTVLKGLLMIPPRNRKHPAAIVMGGSGWGKRSDVRARALALAALGFVTLSYDKRGFGESAGEKIVSFESTARDVLAAAAMLKNRTEVDANAIGVLGESQSGWTAPFAASLSTEIKFLILLVPAAVSPAEQETSSRLDQLRAAGFAQSDLDLAARLLEATWRWVRRQDNWDQYQSLRAEAVTRKFPDYVFESDKQTEEEWKDARLNMFYDPCPVLSRIRVPVLAMFGGGDLLVSAAINRPRLAQCLPADNRRVTLHTIPGARHSLAIPNSAPIHRLDGNGDGGFSVLADWLLTQFPILRKA